MEFIYSLRNCNMRDVSLERSEPCSEGFKKRGIYMLDRNKDYIEKIKEKYITYRNSHLIEIRAQ